MDRTEALAVLAPSALLVLLAAAGCGSVEAPPRPPVEGDPPGRDSAATPAAPADEPAVKDLRHLLASLGVSYFPGERRLEVAGWVNMQRGLVELFACAPEGKTHESVVVLDCVPRGLHAGLLALGLQPGSAVELGAESAYKPPTGAPVEITVRWREAGGAERTARAEDWIWNQKQGRPMERCAWVFAGSFLEPAPVDSGEASYAADQVKSLATTYHDSTSILENPHADGIDDTVYYANERAIPPVGTPLTAVFAPATSPDGSGR